jgi:hypothetical protein
MMVTLMRKTLSYSKEWGWMSLMALQFLVKRTEIDQVYTSKESFIIHGGLFSLSFLSIVDFPNDQIRQQCVAPFFRRENLAHQKTA